MAATSMFRAARVAPVPLTALIDTIANEKNIIAKLTMRKELTESRIILASLVNKPNISRGKRRFKIIITKVIKMVIRIIFLIKQKPHLV